MAIIKDIFGAVGYFGSEEDYFRFIDTVKDINMVEEEGSLKSNLLQSAITYNKFNVVKDLINRGIDINYQNSNGETALILSVSHQRPVEWTRLLIENGANVNTLDRHKNNALWYAVMMLRGKYCYYYDNIIELLKNGADPYNVNRYGHTPLSAAQYKKDFGTFFEPYIQTRK